MAVFPVACPYVHSTYLSTISLPLGVVTFVYNKHSHLIDGAANSKKRDVA